MIFFSQPVRGSVDAGQPDPQQISSMLALVAAKEKQKQQQQQQQQQEQQQQQQQQQNSTGSPTSSCSTTTVCTPQQQNGGEKTPDTAKTPTKPNINVTTNPLDISLCAAVAQQTGPRNRRAPGELCGLS